MEIVVASGKGGTGKTFLASNLAYYLNVKSENVIAVDADAEAPDLLLALGGSRKNLFNHHVSLSRKAKINYEKCIKCLKCISACKFYAIEVKNGIPSIIEEYCEGCNACNMVCPVKCIDLYVKETGIVRCDISNCGVIVVTADLEVGGRNSGDLVFMAREEAHKLSRDYNAKHIVIDAAAGIGCPVISSLAGAHILLAVVEPIAPSLSGAKRLLEIAEKMRVKPFIIINRYDMYHEDDVKKVHDLGVEIIGKIPYDKAVVEAYVNMNPVLTYNPNSKASQALIELFNFLMGCVLK